MKTYKVFVSSTFIDLKDHRAYVIDALRKAGFFVDPMEDWTADSDEPKVFSQERVDGCDLCVLLVAFRRGHVPEKEAESITQMEYRYAREHGIDVLPFLLDEQAPWPRQFDELDKDPAIRLWRAELQEHHGVGFFGMAPQTIQIAPALTRWLAKRKEETGPEISYWLGRPASLGDDFVGRNDDMQALANAFSDRRAVVVSGGAGTGKSRLAAEYGHQCGLEGFWTDAGATVAQTLAALAPALDVEIEGRSDQEVAAEVEKRIRELSPETLWALDNLADLSLVNELLGAAGPVRLLITTRDARRELLPGTVAFQRVETLEPDAAIDLLCSRSNCDRKDRALPEIAEAVGCLPLALEMLAVRLGQPRQTPKKLLATLGKAATAIEVDPFQEATGTTIPRADGVFAAITGTLATLPADVREQLSPLGYVADAPVPDALLAALTGLNEGGLDRLLEECGRESVLAAGKGQVVVHALTAAAISATNSAEATIAAVERAQARLTLISRDDPIALRAELAHYEQVYDHATRLIGAEDDSTLSLANSLAIAYRTAGRTEDAIRLHEQTLAARERVLGPDHPDTLASRSNLAIGYRAVGRTEEAIRLHEEALAAKERVLGPDHPSTLRSRNNLANGYQAAGRTEEAIQLHEQTLAARERVLGPDHPDTLNSRSNLAEGYQATGRTEDAARLEGKARGTTKLKRKRRGKRPPG